NLDRSLSLDRRAPDALGLSASLRKRTGANPLDMSALCRLCCKSIFGIWSRNIDSRSDTNEQQRFKRTDAPIRLLQISILQSLLGDFCNTICQKQTFALQHVFLFDHLVGRGQQTRRHFKSERPGRPAGAKGEALVGGGSVAARISED